MTPGEGEFAAVEPGTESIGWQTEEEGFKRCRKSSIACKIM
jgi:hypothetical protein